MTSLTILFQDASQEPEKLSCVNIFGDFYADTCVICRRVRKDFIEEECHCPKRPFFAVRYLQPEDRDTLERLAAEQFPLQDLIDLFPNGSFSVKHPYPRFIDGYQYLLDLGIISLTANISIVIPELKDKLPASFGNVGEFLMGIKSCETNDFFEAVLLGYFHWETSENSVSSEFVKGKVKEFREKVANHIMRTHPNKAELAQKVRDGNNHYECEDDREFVRCRMARYVYFKLFGHSSGLPIVVFCSDGSVKVYRSAFGEAIKNDIDCAESFCEVVHGCCGSLVYDAIDEKGNHRYTALRWPQKCYVTWEDGDKRLKIYNSYEDFKRECDFQTINQPEKRERDSQSSVDEGQPSEKKQKRMIEATEVLPPPPPSFPGQLIQDPGKATIITSPKK